MMFQFIKKVMLPLIKKVMFSFIKKVMLPFCTLLPIIRNDLPLFASAILGPSIYLTIKAFSCLLLLPLFLRLDNHREDEALLTLVLFAFRFATASPYGPCIITFMDIDSCILEYEVMAAAGTIIFLAFFIWAGVIERDMKLLLVVCLVLLASKVVEFSLFVDEVSFFMLLLYFWFLEMLHALRIVDDSVHQQIKITKSEIAYYGFCSCVMICSFNAIVLPANLKNYLL